jgi:hypothetical protein
MEGSMPRLIRIALFIAVAGISSEAVACVYSAKGRVYENGRAYRFRVNSAPCPDQAAPYAPPAVAYAPPVYQAPVPPPPVVYAPPPAYYPPPPVYYAPPPVVVAPTVVAPAPPPKPKRQRPALLAVKWSPGGSAAVDWGTGVSGFGFAHSVGLELRPLGWLSARSDFEWRPEGRSWDIIGPKVSLFPSSALRPYASVSLAASEAYASPGKWQLGLSAAAGLDLFFGRHFFIEAEARYRVSPGPGDCCREVPHFTALVGGGVAFF